MDELKKVSKSVRLTEKVFNYVDAYRGDGFNQKFENLVIDMMEVRDQLVAEHDRLKKLNSAEKKEIMKTKEKVKRLQTLDMRLEPMIRELTLLLDDCTK